MYANNIKNEFIVINDRLYNCFTMIRMIADVAMDGWLNEETGQELKNWVLEYVFGGAMPGFTRFDEVGGESRTFLSALEAIALHWWSLQDEDEHISDGDDISIDTLSSNSVNEVFATAHYVHDAMYCDTTAWSDHDIDGFPIAEGIELVENVWD